MKPLAAVMFIALILASVAVAHGQEATDAHSDYHARARTAVAEVLSSEEFAERDQTTWLSRASSWVLETLSELPKLLGMLPSWLGVVLLIWMLLTLLAILVHLAYVVTGLIRGRDSSHSAANNAAAVELFGTRDMDADTAYAEARRRLAERDWTEAVRFFYVASILLLDRAGFVRLRQGKTNHDYLHELASEPKYRAPFEVLTRCFESSVYGHRPADESMCGQMAEQVDALTDAQHAKI
jgi:Domain of unknown function (DUF4129)